ADAAGQRGGARAVAQVQDDHVQVGGRTVEKVGCSVAYITDGDAVEAVPANAVLGRDSTIDSVGRRGRGQRRMEGGVEDRYLWRTGECRAWDADDRERRRVVRRR